jgi:hypothetical protein
MIKITPEQVEKYRVLYQNKFGKSIDQDAARKELTALVCFIGAVNRHMQQCNWPNLINELPRKIHEYPT